MARISKIVCLDDVSCYILQQDQAKKKTSNIWVETRVERNYWVCIFLNNNDIIDNLSDCDLYRSISCRNEY